MKPKKMRALIIKSAKTEWIFCIKNSVQECKAEFCTGSWNLHDYQERIKSGRMRIAHVLVEELKSK